MCPPARQPVIPPSDSWVHETLMSLTMSRGLQPGRVMADEVALLDWLRGAWRVVEVLEGDEGARGFVGSLFWFADDRIHVAHPTAGYLGMVPFALFQAARDHRMGRRTYPHVGILDVDPDAEIDGEARREVVRADDDDTLHLTWNGESVRLRMERRGG